MSDQQVASSEQQPDVSASQEIVVRSELVAGPKNNMCAYLDSSTRNASSFTGIIDFLKRSRIYRAISTECTAYMSHQREFWSNVVFSDKESPATLRSKIFGKDVVVSADVIRQVVGFEDSADCPVLLNKYLVRGLFLRVKYTGDIQRGVLRNSGLSPQYKYLAHVLQHCLSPRRAGHDEMRESIQDAFAALVLNIPFNFSAMVFSNMIENITSKKEAYLMYARFLQMIINSQAPDLPKEESDVIPVQVMNDMTFNRLKSYKSKTGGEPTVRPPMKRLIGHLANPSYVFPGGKRWRHEDSDSDVENLLVAEDSEGEREGDDEVESETVETSSAAADVGGDTQGPQSAQSGQGEGLRRKKRIRGEGSSSRSLDDFLDQKKLKKRKKFIYKALPGSANVPESGSGAQTRIPVVPPTPAQASTAAQTAESSQVVSMDQINILNNLVIRMMNEQKEQADMIKKLIEENQSLREERDSRDAEIERMNKRIDDQASQITTQQNLLLTTSTELSEVKEDYKTFRSSLSIERDGVLKIKDKEDDEDETDDESTDDDAEPSQPKEG